METIRTACVGGLLSLAILSTASATDVAARRLGHATSVQPVTYEYAASASTFADEPIDEPAPPIEEATVGCQSACGVSSHCCGRCRSCDDGWALPQPSIFASRGIEIGGWLSAGLYTNSHGAPTNGPLGYHDLAGTNMHQFWLYAQKAADTGGCGTDWGVRIDYVYGIDGQDEQSGTESTST